MLFVTANDLCGPCIVCNNVDESAIQTHKRPSLSADITRRESIMTTTQVTAALCP